MKYSTKVIEHFMSPRNVGEIAGADGVGQLGSLECGDILKVWIKVSNEHLTDIKYKVMGCPAAIAVCSVMSEMALGMHIDQACELTDDQIADALGGLPEEKLHCSNLAATALHKAILDYVLNGAQAKLSVTVLVDNIARQGLMAEHGLSLWIDDGKNKALLDTGQGSVIQANCQRLGIDLPKVNTVVLSHGHYDHTGGLKTVLDGASKVNLYLHPKAVEPKFSCHPDQPCRSVGMPLPVVRSVKAHNHIRNLFWIEKPTIIRGGLTVTGPIPRHTDFEDVGGPFYLDSSRRQTDDLVDDQAIFFESDEGLVVMVGCAHAGIVNTLDYVSKLTGRKTIHTVLGGIHLSSASHERIERTINAFQDYGVQQMALAHCTGKKPFDKFKRAFGDKCQLCFVGGQMTFRKADEPQ